MPNKSLKATNGPLLVIAVAGNILAFHLAAQGNAIFNGDSWAAFKNIATLVPAGIGVILVSVLNAQLDAMTKARLVFWRWKNPLPGSEAFSRHAKNDPRVDMEALAAKFGPLPTAPREQNALWYRLFKSVGDDVSVSHVHREFLFTRDYAVLSLFMLVGLGGLAAYQMPPGSALIYLFWLIIQYLLARRAAITHGNRFVTTVLALNAAR